MKWGNGFSKNKNVSTKILHRNNKKIWWKFFQGYLLSLRKWFCNNKKISTKISNQNNGKLYFILWISISISKERHIPEKKFPTERFMKISLRKLFSKKNFDQNFFWKFFYPNCFRGNNFATIKKFLKKI